MPNQTTLDLLDKANSAIYKAEQAIRKEEKATVNKPMYRIRLEFASLTRRYMANQPMCDMESKWYIRPQSENKVADMLTEIHKITNHFARRVVGEASKRILNGETIVEFNVEADEEILTKLKDLGYEQAWKECTDCEGVGIVPFKTEVTAAPEQSTILQVGDTITVPIACRNCKGTGGVRKLVEWDREKVATELRRFDKDYSLGDERHDYLGDVDQLYKILTGGE